MSNEKDKNDTKKTLVQVIDLEKRFSITRGLLRKTRGYVRAVDGVNLSISKGEIFGLIGPDGAGKSSLMKAAVGVLSYEGGMIEAFGVPID